MKLSIDTHLEQKTALRDVITDAIAAFYGTSPEAVHDDLTADPSADAALTEFCQSMQARGY